MQLFYTGADSSGEAQKDKDKSLGGFLSSTPIPNDDIGNLFGSVSKYGLDEKLRETRALMLTNNTGNPVTDVKLYFEKEVGAVGKFEVAAVTTVVDGLSTSMESIGNIRSSPFTGTFVEAEGVANEVTLTASLADGATLGLWFRRILEDSDSDGFDCDTLLENFESGTPVVTEGGVDIIISYT